MSNSAFRVGDDQLSHQSFLHSFLLLARFLAGRLNAGPRVGGKITLSGSALASSPSSAWTSVEWVRHPPSSRPVSHMKP